MFQRHQSGVVGGADDLIISLIGGRPKTWGDIVTGQTLRITDGIILPWLVLDTIQRPLENPVPRPRRVRCLDDNISDLEDLVGQKKPVSVTRFWEYCLLLKYTQYKGG